jgi:hypothetical protein
MAILALIQRVERARVGMPTVAVCKDIKEMGWPKQRWTRAYRDRLF